MRIFYTLLLFTLLIGCEKEANVTQINFVHDNVEQVSDGYFIQHVDTSEIKPRSSSCSADIDQLARIMIAWDCVGTVRVTSIKPNGNYVSEFTGVNPNWRHIYEVGDTFETPHLFLRT